MIRIPISTEYIRLTQFLKLAEAVQNGVEAKIRIQHGEVTVNYELELRRGRKLKTGDRVDYGGKIYVVSQRE